MKRECEIVLDRGMDATSRDALRIHAVIKKVLKIKVRYFRKSG